jgi:predicted Rossmann-fold nucleotide-binding protein
MLQKTQVSLHGPSRHVNITRRNNGAKAIDQFKRDRGIAFTLAFSGGADDKSPALDAFTSRLTGDDRIPHEVRRGLKDTAKGAVRENSVDLVRSILEPLRGYRIAILTGGTKWGIPDVATHVAKELGFPTIGIYPFTAQKKRHVLKGGLLDLSVCVYPFVGESCWGDESAIFTKLLDSVVVVGGGAGTMVEVAHLLKLNERSSQSTKWIIPVHGTGGTADKLSFFPGKPATVAKCIPAMPITSGQEVVEFLHNYNVLTDDIYEPA